MLWTATSGKSECWQLSGQQPGTLFVWPKTSAGSCISIEKVANRVRRAAPPMWDAGAPWSAIFLKAAEDDETYWDDNIRHPAMSWLAHGGRGAPKARERERRKGRKGQRCALHRRSSRCAVVFQLEFWWWDVWRAFTRKPMSSWQSLQMHHVSKHSAKQCPQA